MRKFAIGCGSVLLVLLLAGGGVAWWFLGRPALAVYNAVRDAQRIEAIYHDPRIREAYQPPADGILEEGQVERWLAVQEALKVGLADKTGELRERYRTLEERLQNPGPREFATFVSEAADLLTDAARVHVEALRTQRFSVEEYRWVRDQVFAAAGFALGGVDVTDLAASAREAGSDAAPRDPHAPPAANVERVAPHRDRVEEALAFAWFGL